MLTRCCVWSALVGVAFIGSTARSEEALVGHWLEHSPTAKIRMDAPINGGFGGWQTSDLTYDPHEKTWWAIGDQNAREVKESFPEHYPYKGRFLYRFTSIEPPRAEPVPIWWEQAEVFNAVQRSFEKLSNPFIDFEGLAADPTRANHFFACTEGPEPWLVELEYRPAERRAVVLRAVRISNEACHDCLIDGKPVVASTNRRWEGLTLSLDGQTLYLVTEWADSPARLYTVSLAEFRRGAGERTAAGWTPPVVLPKPLETGRLEGELTGVCVAQYGDKPHLLVLERNTPKKTLPPSIYVIDLANPKNVRRHSVTLRAPALNGDPAGVEINSASPEGIACDDTGRVLLISDPARDPTPDHSRPELDFYKALTPGRTDDAKLDAQIPLVFELNLSRLPP